MVAFQLVHSIFDFYRSISIDPPVPYGAGEIWNLSFYRYGG